MPVQIQLRRGLAADWTSANPILAEGEVGVELDSDGFKIGDGVAHWLGLPYSIGGIGATGATGATGGTGGTGAPGTPGTKWYAGPGLPNDGVGIDGDFYLNTTNGDVYIKVGTTWGA
jgi:hypothetical protein